MRGSINIPNNLIVALARSSVQLVVARVTADLPRNSGAVDSIVTFPLSLGWNFRYSD